VEKRLAARGALVARFALALRLTVALETTTRFFAADGTQGIAFVLRNIGETVDGAHATVLCAAAVSHTRKEPGSAAAKQLEYASHDPACFTSLTGFKPQFLAEQSATDMSVLSFPFAHGLHRSAVQSAQVARTLLDRHAVATGNACPWRDATTLVATTRQLINRNAVT
jgi:hypothetical protein